MNRNPEKIPLLERLGVSLDGIRSWIIRAWKMGTMMAKGAYLLGERKALFLKLGQEVYKQYQSGDIQRAALEPIVRQLDRLHKKVEIEERLIENLQYGRRRGHRPTTGETPTESASS